MYSRGMDMAQGSGGGLVTAVKHLLSHIMENSDARRIFYFLVLNLVRYICTVELHSNVSPVWE